jgi:hypothetical protein
MIRRLLALVLTLATCHPGRRWATPIRCVRRVEHFPATARITFANAEFLANSESKLIRGGPNTCGRVREALPNVNGAGLAKAAGFNQLRPRTPVAATLSDTYRLTGYRLARRSVPSLSPNRFVGQFRTVTQRRARLQR